MHSALGFLSVTLSLRCFLLLDTIRGRNGTYSSGLVAFAIYKRKRGGTFGLKIGNE